MFQKNVSEASPPPTDEQPHDEGMQRNGFATREKKVPVISGEAAPIFHKNGFSQKMVPGMP